jgi:Tfp pilus assembly protein PilN
MLRTNLSTRPFYNERAARAALGLAALLLLSLTVFNAVQGVSLRGRERELSGRATGARNEAEVLRAEAQRVRTQIDPKELATVSAAAREANDLIAQRTFSWVQLFQQLESTLPAGVRLTSIEPRIDEGVVTVSMTVEARSYDALSTFMEALESRGGFRKVLPPVTSEDGGLIDATVEGMYAPAPPVAAGESLQAEATRGPR